MSETQRLSACNVPEDVVAVVTACEAWHSSRVAKLQEVIATPEGTKLVIKSAEGKEVELTGKTRAGFIAGLHTALSFFETFPLQINRPSKEFSEGCVAWGEGEEISDCPYGEGTDEATQWQAGWTFEDEVV